MTNVNEELEKLIDDGFINRQKHPVLDIYIYNYTIQTQYEKFWNKWTLACRGLIMDSKYKVIARPFSKFFNLEECVGIGVSIPNEKFKVYEKLDGSLGILYWDGDTPAIATRGSFSSDQAVYATTVLLPKYQDFISSLDKDYTYLFEIIYPANQIVLDYRTQEKLVLLAALEIDSGKEIDIQEINWPEKAKIFDGIDDLELIQQMQQDNQEGFVIRFDSGLRVKYKFEEYKRLHRLLTGISKKNIWEMLAKEEDIKQLLENVPDEFYSWVKQSISEIQTNYQKILEESLEIIKDNGLDKIDRKSAAQIVLKKYQNLSKIIFTILDHKNPKHHIFKMIKPDTQNFFTKDLDE